MPLMCSAPWYSMGFVAVRLESVSDGKYMNSLSPTNLLMRSLGKLPCHPGMTPGVKRHIEDYFNIPGIKDPMISHTSHSRNPTCIRS